MQRPYAPNAIRYPANFEGQLTGGQTVAAFSRARRMEMATLDSWKKKYPYTGKGGPARFCQIVPKSGPVERRLRLPSGLEMAITGLSTREIADLILEIDRTYA